MEASAPFAAMEGGDRLPRERDLLAGSISRAAIRPTPGERFSPGVAYFSWLDRADKVTRIMHPDNSASG